MRTVPEPERVGNLAEGVELLEPEHAQFYQEMGYTGVCRVNGQVVGVMQFIFTFGVCVGLDATGYSHRFCYGSFPEAVQGLAQWITEGGDEPKGYIKRKPEL